MSCSYKQVTAAPTARRNMMNANQVRVKMADFVSIKRTGGNVIVDAATQERTAG